MTDSPIDTGQRSRRLRTWSAFGDIRRRPSDYEIVTHSANWTTRRGRKAPLEQDPSSLLNQWLRTYRDDSPLAAEDWDGFRDPDAMTYRRYVTMQSEQEAKVRGVLDRYSDADADKGLDPQWRRVLASLVTPARYPLHGLQQILAYFGYMAPSSYIANAASFAVADVLRRVSLTAYRTRELQLAWPEDGFATGEREIFENHQAWQPTRRAVERALVTYDWAEAFTAANLVLLPALDDVLLRQSGELARHNGDEEMWLVNGFLRVDSQRRDRWSVALANFAVAAQPDNAEVLHEWIERWSPLADAAVMGLAQLLAAAPHQAPKADEVMDGAQQARTRLLEQIEPGHTP
jgi:toluene monooxygenase system protein E